MDERRQSDDGLHLELILCQLAWVMGQGAGDRGLPDRRGDPPPSASLRVCGSPMEDARDMAAAWIYEADYLSVGLKFCSSIAVGDRPGADFVVVL